MTEKQHTPNNWGKILGIRLLEIFVLGGMLLYGNHLTMGKDIEHIKESQSELKDQVDKIIKDFYVPRVNREQKRTLVDGQKA